MEQQNSLSQKLKKRRQLLLVSPLLILPFMTLAFWALGGGQQQREDGPAPVTGINRTVPRAKSTEASADKMTLYAEADRKAAAAKQNGIENWGRFRYPDSMVTDSTYERGGLSAGTEIEKFGMNDKLHNPLQDNDPNSLKIRQKLADLQAVLKRAETVHHSALALPIARRSQPAADGLQSGEVPGAKPGERTAQQTDGSVNMEIATGNEESLDELDHLKDLITQSADIDGSDDTREINTMLDKILAIQHPAAQVGSPNAASDPETASNSTYPVTVVKARQKNDVEVPVLLPVRPAGMTDSVNDLILTGEADSTDAHQDAGGSADMQNYYSMHSRGLVSAFYDIDVKDKKTDNDNNAYANTTISADIAGTQTLVSGGTVKMRLKTDVIIQGKQIPKGSFVYGACRVNGERLKIEVRHIRLGNQLFTVKLRVFDLDGMEGIHIPGSINRDAAKQGAARGFGSVQMMSLDPSAAAQAATAGMEAAKGLLSKKAKLVRVTVKAGYPILLLDGKGLQ